MDDDLLSKTWKDNVVWETDHYYQEMQRQEDRSSWLLAASSALIALLLGGSISLLTELTEIQIKFFIISISLFLISSAFSILGITPLTGSKSASIITNMSRFYKSTTQSRNDFGKELFSIKNENPWKATQDKDWLLDHLRVHYQQNLIKSTYTLLASWFLGFGLVFSSILVILHIYII